MKKVSKEKGQVMDSRHIEGALEKNGDLYKLVVENVHDGLYILDREGRFTFVNEIALRRSGYARERFIGRSCFEFIRPEDKDPVKRGFEAVLRGEAVPAYELSYTAASGETLWVEINATCLNDNGRIIGVLAVSREITDRKRIEEELALYRNSLENIVEMRTAELMRANEQLQREINEHKKAEEALRDSENYYRTIFENTGTAMIIMEEDTIISLANAESMKFVGYAPTALEGRRKAIEFVARGDLERIKGYQKLRQIDPGKAPRNYELKIRDRTGDMRDVLVTIATIPGTKKNIASFIDITERKRVEEALAASEEKYRNIFENATEGIFQTAIEGGLLSANPSFARLFGYRSPEETLKSVKDMPYGLYVDSGQRVELGERLTKQGFVRNFEILCRRKDGKKIWISTNIRALKGSDGKPLLYEGTLVDITERKSIQDDLESKSRSLEETNSALRVLLKHREQDQGELEEKVLYNVKGLVLPYVEKLKATLRNEQRTMVDIIETNLNDVLSPFIKGMAQKFANLTPKEIQIADLIKKGKATKEISEILSISVRTVDIHRHNIRKKLDLGNKKMNLQSYLLSLS
jgi:PAS domain S-box-containing protein